MDLNFKNKQNHINPVVDKIISELIITKKEYQIFFDTNNKNLIITDDEMNKIYVLSKIKFLKSKIDFLCKLLTN